MSSETCTHTPLLEPIKNAASIAICEMERSMQLRKIRVKKITDAQQNIRFALDQ